jgi:small subunit ribosomal protein S21
LRCVHGRGACPIAKEVNFLAVVFIDEGESFENALKRFKRMCEREGILSEIKKRQHFEKPSETKKKKQLEAQKKLRRKLQQERRKFRL